MAYTNTTPNYNLPQWVATDNPTWLQDVNGAFSDIDTAMDGIADSIPSNLSSRLTAVETAVAALPAELADRLTKLETLCAQLKGGCFSTYPIGPTNP